MLGTDTGTDRPANVSPSPTRREDKSRVPDVVRTLAALAFGVLPIAILAAPANAEEAFGIASFTAGAANTQAGAHSDVTTAIGFNLKTFPDPPESFFGPLPVEDVQTIAFELPPGLLANAANAPACTRENLADNGNCPPETQVGNAVVHTNPFIAPPLGELPNNPIYNVTPAPGQAASLGLTVGSSRLPAFIDVGVRNDSDYRVTAITRNVEVGIPIKDIAVTLWGVPADSAHDPLRYDPDGSGTEPTPGYGNPSPGPRTPFMVNPTDCATTPVTGLQVTSYAGTGPRSSTADSPKPTGCDSLEFTPSISVVPDNTTPDAPTGLGVRLDLPQNDDPDDIATPALRDTTVELPEGMTINPGAADGLTACTDAQSAIGTEAEASCPESSKIGTIDVDVPALRKPLEGGLFIGTQESDDPASGKMFRMFLVANGQGVRLKLEGAVRADPATGRLRASFSDNPQVPVSSIALHFKDGPRAVLANPPTCGPKTVTATLSSWGGPSANVESRFAIDCLPGLGDFAPSFSAGAIDPLAGAASPFDLTIGKPDGQADLNGLRLDLPEGLLATIKGNLGSRIGTATVAAGPGSNPYFLSGPVVLEGAYGDAPYSLRVTVPAKAGPFDLGDVVVRQKLYVDPHDAHVTIVSDPLPTIVKGVPVRLQKLHVVVDKPGFMRNPTSCATKTISGTLGSVRGQTATVSSRFQVGGCDKLPLKPRLTLAMTDRAATRQGKTTPFSATVRQTPGQTGLKKAVVTLPPTLSLLADNAQALCKPEQAAARACPVGSVVGSASAVTPLLAEPLAGPVYFVEGTRKTSSGAIAKTLPKLWVALRGPFSLDLWADTDVKDDRLVNTFGFVPDAPITTFQLKIDGGKHGILAVSSKNHKADVCSAEQTADAVFDGQNGKRIALRPKVITPCGYRVIAKTLYSTTAKIRVGGIGRGQLRLSGTGIKSVSRKIRSATVASLHANLTKAGKRRYRQHRAIRLRVRFTPATAGARTKSARATVRHAKPKARATTTTG